MNKILLITPPLLQPNTPYPATPYLKGYLTRKGFEAQQLDLGAELFSEIFSRGFISALFDAFDGMGSENVRRIFRLRKSYETTVDTVMKFLRGEDNSVANLICGADFLPQAGRFEAIEDMEAAYGTSGMIDCAKYLATLYIEDLSDFIRETAAPHFGIARYGEKIALSVDSFKILQNELDKPVNAVEARMIEILDAAIAREKPSFAGFTVPFPGNLLAALRCAQHIKSSHPAIKIIFGGGYPSTELRSLTDAAVFDYVDFIVLDDGELPLERIIAGSELVRTFVRERKEVKYYAGEGNITHTERGCPDFAGMSFGKYVSLSEVTNPMQRLWGDGQWNKMAAAHGCYWAKCAFCDTTLDYICGYDAPNASTIVDWMECIMSQTGLSGFHFVDEALPPKLARDMALEIIHRGLKVSWWGNVRFEPFFTADVCLLLAASGCIAVSGGVETASDRLLELMKKGITIEQLTITLRNFYYAGIMVHAYLMYGFPTQTAQETVDSLEIVRQLFRAELIGSAFWHRFAMTRHSHAGQNPSEYGVRIKNNIIHKFANNEVEFAENRNYDIDVAGEALRTATYNYMRQTGFDIEPHKWFAHKSPQTAVENTAITDHLIKPDSSRIFSDAARIVWIGNQPVRTAEGLLFTGNSKEKDVKFSESDAAFMLEAIALCSHLETRTTLGELKTLYQRNPDAEPFTYLYHSKKWDILRGFGLLQV